MNQIIREDGNVTYRSTFLTEEESLALLQKLLAEIRWEPDRVHLFGRVIKTKRSVAWHGDRQFPYTYSGFTRIAQEWTPDLLAVKRKVEATVGATFNSCLLNLYHDGKEGMGWHSDDEPEMKKLAPIASISLGETRIFEFEHKLKNEKIGIELENGSLLMMSGPTQEHWKHQLKKKASIKSPRINLTFRTFIEI